MDVEQWRRKIGNFSHVHYDMKRRYPSSVLRMGDLYTALGIHQTLATAATIVLLLLVSGVEPNPGPATATGVLSNTGVNRCMLCHGNTDTKEVFECSHCSNIVHLSCVIKCYKIKEGVNLKNSISWLHEFLLFAHFKFTCGNCVKIITSYAESSTSPIHSGYQPECSITMGSEPTHQPAKGIDVSTNTDASFFANNDAYINTDVSSRIDVCTNTEAKYSSSEIKASNYILAHGRTKSELRKNTPQEVYITRSMTFYNRSLRRPNNRAEPIRHAAVRSTSVKQAPSEPLSLPHAELTNASTHVSCESVHASSNVGCHAAINAASSSHQFLPANAGTVHSTSGVINTSSTLSCSNPPVNCAIHGSLITTVSSCGHHDSCASASVPSAVTSVSHTTPASAIVDSQLTCVDAFVNSACGRESGSDILSSTTQSIPVDNSARNLPSTASTSCLNDYEIGCYRKSAAELLAARDGLHPINVTGDGACLFRTVCISESGSDANHLTLRAAAIDYMRDNPEQFTQFGDLDPDEMLPFDKYLLKISRPTQEVGEFVLSAIANILMKGIRVYYGDGKSRVYFPHFCIGDNESSFNCINILYYDVLNSNSGHYMALTKDHDFNIDHNIFLEPRNDQVDCSSSDWLRPTLRPTCTVTQSEHVQENC